MREQDFLDAVLDRPLDDMPRMIYADWLEENADDGSPPMLNGLGVPITGTGHPSDGRRDRAEFIRLQIALPTLDPFDGYECKCCGNRPRHEEGFDLGELGHGRGCYTQSEDGGGSEFIDVSPEYTAKKKRHADLLGSLTAEFRLSLPPCRPLTNWRITDDFDDRPSEEWSAFVRRGFIERVSLPLAALTDDVARRLGRTPGLLEVDLSDVGPFGTVDYGRYILGRVDDSVATSWAWVDEQADTVRQTPLSEGLSRPWLPSRVFNLLVGGDYRRTTNDSGLLPTMLYPDRTGAETAGRRAALNHCRILAGLLPVWHPVTREHVK